jgi:hypothetical protein
MEIELSWVCRRCKQQNILKIDVDHRTDSVELCCYAYLRKPGRPIVCGENSGLIELRWSTVDGLPF